MIKLSEKLFIFYHLIQLISCATPQAYYANIGDQARLQCNAGSYACYSTYTLQNTAHAMVMLNNTRKYQIAMGSITINNVQATDAGFYACASSCEQLKSDQISYYLHPMTMGQPIDTSKSWIAIPPLPYKATGFNDNQLYVVVSDERLYAAHGSKALSGGEIAGLVIGLVAAFLITVAIIILLIFLNRRRKQNREKSVDYSTIERDFSGGMGGESATNTLTKDSNQNLQNNERKSLANNRADISNLSNIVSEINTRNIQGPQSYKPSDMTLINPKDLPNIDIGFNNKTNSQRSQQPSTGYENQFNPLNQKNPSISISKPVTQLPQQQPGNNLNNKPKVQFPSRNNVNKPAEQPRYVSNENIYLQQIIKESGFVPDMLDNAGFDKHDFDDFKKENPKGKTGFITTRNLDSYPFQNEMDIIEPEDLETQKPDQQQQLVNLDNEGGVTVVSARTPAQRNEQKLTVLPPSYQATKYSYQQQPHQANRQIPPPHLSFSQRIETTSTPLQLNQAPSHSLRTGLASLAASNTMYRDGATDV